MGKATALAGQPARYHSVAPTITDGAAVGLQVDVNGNLKTTATIIAGDIEIGQVELKDSDSTALANIKAANTARTTGTVVVATQPIDAAGNVLGRTAANTARTTGTLVDPVQLVDAAGVVGAVNGNVASGAADSGNPIKVGLKYNASAPTLDDGDRGDLQGDVNSRLIISPLVTKSLTTIQDWTAVAQNTVAKSAEISLTTINNAILSIQAALDTATAHTGTRFILQISFSATGNEDWVNLADFVGLIGTANSEAVTNNPLAAGGTTITCASTTGYTTLAQRVFIKDATLIDSEIVIQNAVTADTSIGLLDGVTNAHANTAVLFNVCMLQIISIPQGALRLRIMVDNSYDADGSTLNYKAIIETN